VESWFVLLPGLPLSLPVLLPSTLLLFFHFAGGLHGLPNTLTLGFIFNAWVADPHAVPQLLLPESSTPIRIMDRPACPFTWSSAQKSVASADVILLSTHWLLAPKPEIVWYFVVASIVAVPAKTGATANNANTSIIAANSEPAPNLFFMYPPL
jgi:hypothetical protein